MTTKGIQRTTLKACLMDIIVYQVEARDAENAGVHLVSFLTYKKLQKGHPLDVCDVGCVFCISRIPWKHFCT